MWEVSSRTYRDPHTGESTTVVALRRRGDVIRATAWHGLLFWDFSTPGQVGWRRVSLKEVRAILAF